MKIIVIVLACLSISMKLQAMPSGGCSRKYDDLLRQAVSVKKECGKTEVHDCCVVSVNACILSRFNTLTCYQRSFIPINT